MNRKNNKINYLRKGQYKETNKSNNNNNNNNVILPLNVTIHASTRYREVLKRFVKELFQILQTNISHCNNRAQIL